MIWTPLCGLLGIEPAILQGGMAWAATAELAVVVSNAGALGIVGAGDAPPEAVRSEIRRVRELTPRPFGANVPLFTAGAEETLQVFAEEGRGCQRRALRGDAAESWHPRHPCCGLCGPGPSDGPPGGRCPHRRGHGIGRGLATALALGAVGVQMGTRFICTTECQAHARYKGRIVEAHDRATLVTGDSFRHPVRSIRGPFVRRLEEWERAEISEKEFIEFGAGTLRVAIVDGDLEQGSVMAGQSAGLVDDIVPVQVLVDRVMWEAEATIRRSANMLGG